MIPIDFHRLQPNADMTSTTRKVPILAGDALLASDFGPHAPVMMEACPRYATLLTRAHHYICSNLCHRLIGSVFLYLERYCCTFYPFSTLFNPKAPSLEQGSLL